MNRVIVLTALLIAGAFGKPATPTTTSPLNALSIQGRGASVPFFEVEAEDADNNGQVVGPDRTYYSLPAEASGRKALQLNKGQYVEFTLSGAANALMIRFSIPDSGDGSEYTSPLSLSVNGEQKADITLTNKYSHQYGSYTCCDPTQFSNNPGLGNHEHYFDTALVRLDTTVQSGGKIRLQVPDGSQAESVTIDVVDFEVVPDPLPQPEGSINIVSDFQADPSGNQDSLDAIQNAVNAGRDQGRVVYIPEGRFKVTNHIVVDQVTVRGAGPWHSILTGGNRDAQPDPTSVGFYGKNAGEGGSHNVQLSDFAIIGEVDERRDRNQVNGLGGAYSDSRISNLFIQHTKCGAWLDGPMNNLTLDGLRILDQFADGVNFHMGVTNSVVSNSFVRTTGDDGLAMWAENQPNVANSFLANTVLHPVLANNIAIYGGQDITVNDNVVADTLSNGGGIHVGNRYPGVNPGGTGVAGVCNVQRNTVLRGGNTDYNWPFPVGAVWFDAVNGALDGARIVIQDTDILDSSYAAIHTVENTIAGLEFTNVNIDGTGTFALQLQSNGGGSFNNVVASHIGFGDNAIYSCLGEGNFAFNIGSGNSGWNEKLPQTYCGEFPPPNYDHGR